MTVILTTIAGWLGKRPEIGTILSGTGVATGSMLNGTLDMIEQLASIGAYGLAIITSVLTIYGWFEKRKEKRKIKQDELGSSL